MNTKNTARTMIAAIMVVSLGMSGPALAGERHNGGHGGGHGNGHGYSYGGGHRYKSNRHHGGYGGHTTDYSRYRNNSHEDLLVGLLVGGVAGYALNNAQRRSDTRDNRHSHSRTVYTAANTHAHRGSTCLQEREYQTTIIVGGHNVDAYGTACLQPGGSWKRGPAQTASH